MRKPFKRHYGMTSIWASNAFVAEIPCKTYNDGTGHPVLRVSNHESRHGNRACCYAESDLISSAASDDQYCNGVCHCDQKIVGKHKLSVLHELTQKHAFLAKRR